MYGGKFFEKKSDAGVYRYGFNGKWNDRETGYQDYGFRMYSTKARRFNQVDPLAVKYPGISSYAFCLNNPIMYMDPDGRDAVISIIRNKDGGGVIKITTVVHVNGNGISQRMSPSIMQDYNSNAKNSFKEGFYKDKDGGVWKEVFNIQYVYDKDMTKEKLPTGHNLMTIDKSNPNITDGRAITKGNAIYMLPPDLYTYTATHETGHAIGLTDRYSGFRFKDANGDIQEGFLSHKGYNKNLMGGLGTEINQDQYNNWGEQLLNKSKELGKDNFILQGSVEYITENGKNFKNPYTQIDPQEKQDYINNFNKNLKSKKGK